MENLGLSHTPCIRGRVQLVGEVLIALIQDSGLAAKYFTGSYLGKFLVAGNGVADVMIQAFKK